MERQLTTEEEEIFHRLFPDEEELAFASFFSPSVPALERGRLSSPEYFETLVLKSTAIESLTHVKIFARRDDNEDDDLSLPLYQATGSGNSLILQTVVGSSQGVGLSLRVLSNMVGTHLEMQLQHETRKILEQKTTCSEQMERISRMMGDYGAYLLTLNQVIDNISSLFFCV